MVWYVDFRAFVSNDIDLCHQFNTFNQSLSALQQAIEPITKPADKPATTHLDAIAASEICEQVNNLQQQFQSILVALSSAVSESAIAPAVAQRIGPYQTEAHRRVRLISIESMRLKTARQPALIDRVRSQLLRHLSQLQQFMQAMTAEVCEAEDSGVS